MRYHLVGIGGSMMSGLAEILKSQGHKVSGSDLATTGHSAENIAGADRIVFSPAVKIGSPGYVELEAAEGQQIPTIRLEDLIAELTQGVRLVAVTGTHGKSSTTALVAAILIEAGRDPTVLLGAPIPEWGGSNYRVGHKDLWVLEADDYDRKFLKYNPHIVVITNIEAEHLDIYKSLEDVEQAFGAFVKRVDLDGLIVAHNDATVRKVVSNNFESQDIIFYDLDDEYAEAVSGEIKLIGKYQVENGVAAIRACEGLGVDLPTALSAISKFKGVGRRLEYIGEKNQVSVYDDYGHHPTEVKVTIEALKEKFSGRRLVVAFQAHQHSRVSKLYKDFLSCFNSADKVLIVDIYAVPGREEIEKVDSSQFAQDIEASGAVVKYVGSLEGLYGQLDQELIPGDVFVTIGATAITEVGRRWVKKKS